MVERPMKMPAKKNTEDDTPEVVSQRVKPERGRYLLQVDRQTKGSFQDMETAQSAGLEIKKGRPILQPLTAFFARLRSGIKSSTL